MLEEISTFDCKSLSFPIQHQHKLGEADGEKSEDPVKYRRLIGKILYLTITILYWVKRDGGSKAL